MGSGVFNVSFDDKVKIVQIPSLESLLHLVELKTDLWYSKAEITAIAREAKSVVRRFEAGKQRASDHLRGLERGTDAGFYQSLKNKHQAYRAIWRERLRQERLGINDAEGIQKAYATVSNQCAQAAVDVAILDSLHDIEEGLCPYTNYYPTSWMFTTPASWFGFRKTPPLWQPMVGEELEESSIQNTVENSILPACPIRAINAKVGYS